MPLRIYNTLTRTKEAFEPIQPGKVGIYLCGPTVYAPAHIGHMVGPVIFDSIKRYLTHSGYETTWVVNITDVDDKLIDKSRERGISMAQLATENTADYMSNLIGVGVDQIDHMPKATENMGEIIALIEGLIERGFAYESQGDVYFDVAKDGEYGKLTNRSPDALMGEGGEGASKKRSENDFALWKSAKEGEPAWSSPWGEGRPGWHIECSAMSRRLLGETFDIHGGGLDLIFPHHENEIAQSECCHGAPMAKIWMHNGLLRREEAGKIGGRSDRDEAEAPTLEKVQEDLKKKISRSGGAGGLAEMIRELGGETIRFFLLRTHYRSTVLMDDAGMNEAAASLETFYRFFERLERVADCNFYKLSAARHRPEGEFDPGGDPLLQTAHRHRTGFLEKMDDDFNTGGAISELFELVRALNKFVDQSGLENKLDEAALASLQGGVAVLRELSALLGLFQKPPVAQGGDDELIGQVLDLMLELRAEARQKKDFETSDKIRARLSEMGVTLEDRKEGASWRLG